MLLFLVIVVLTKLDRILNIKVSRGNIAILFEVGWIFDEVMDKSSVLFHLRSIYSSHNEIAITIDQTLRNVNKTFIVFETLLVFSLHFLVTFHSVMAHTVCMVFSPCNRSRIVLSP